MKIKHLPVFCFVLFFSYAGIGVSAADEQPNIVVLFADDAGYADFGFQPNCKPDMKAMTPRIDSIAAKGCRFANAYMSGTVCSPSRAGLMTGRYQQRFGHDNNIPPGYMRGGLPLSETFGAKRLQGLGYQTGLIGKWHLGYPTEYHPNQRGFDFFYGCLQGSRSYFPIESPSPHRVFMENDAVTEEGGYTTDRIGDGACRFISENRDRPFYLFVSFTAPHGPLQAKPTHLEKLAGIEKPRRKKYAGLIVSLDENVGKILDCLQENQLDNKTLVIFTNDNGGQTQTGADNSPLRGRKGQLWEGGMKVPMAARWPGKINPGSVVESPVISLDLNPTFIEMAGARIEPEWKWDGTSMLSLWNKNEADKIERTLFWRRTGKNGGIAARRGPWKLIQFSSNDTATPSKPMLFHLPTDASESKNVAGQNPTIVEDLKSAIDRWNAELSEPLWGPGSKGFSQPNPTKQDTAKTDVKLPEIRDELKRRVDLDQKFRMQWIEAAKQGGAVNPDLLKKVTEIDRENTAWLKQQVDKHGWLGKTLVGVEGAHNAWLLVQHADRDLKFQQRCVKLMQAMPKGEVAAIDIAYLTDRVLVAANKKQRFGTQCTMINGKASVKDVEDPDNLDKRRAELGLPPIAEYLKTVESMYSKQTKPDKKKSENPAADDSSKGKLVSGF